MKVDWLDAATHIGNRLAATAIWNGDVCSWLVTERAGWRASVPVERLADGGLYGGTAGIGLFLLELAAATDRRDLWRVGVAAVVNAQRAVMPRRASFFSGDVGLCYVLARAAVLSGNAEFANDARTVVANMLSEPLSQQQTDVIAGAAGAVPPLLAIDEMIGEPSARELAVRLGKHLIATARRRSIGWSWPTSSVPRTHDLTGFAHGAAGYATAFATLLLATGDAVFRYAAERTLEYEDVHYVPAVANWLDFRRNDLAEHLRNGDVDAALHELEEESRAQRTMSAWCHGAPGCLLARAIAWPALGERVEPLLRTSLDTVIADVGRLPRGGLRI